MVAESFVQIRVILKINSSLCFNNFVRRQQEGNYAPEEKYGASERRQIRSSNDSDTVAASSKSDVSFSGNSNTTGEATVQKSDVDTSRLSSDVTCLDTST